MALGQFMPERPGERDDAVIEDQPPLELSREPRVGAPDTPDVADDADDHESHDPYQPL
ncbi:hypothetical protein SAMN05444858_12110 [Micromonospora avicenniae]|uniref:Uncharacterized protein n=2 Tax=Micromonospora avicenniae TaxID=1198245 RepID=A0A1N7E686_9ACTN|nr:hypothetical protein SAMN05444858_12110 [Micromonospora avicenniae]